MAIGDTLNQNPFGTNYNAEEEEKKKAELAAQGAMMGAGVGTQDPLLRSFEDSLLKGQSQNNPFGQAGTQAGQEMANNIRESRGIPASAFGQAPAVNPFSMEAAGQVNPMMEQQSIPTESVSNLITDNPFIATGGTSTTAQPNVNFNAFSAADQANPAFKDMSAAEILNKFNEPGYTTPPLVEPTFFERPKSRFRGFVDPIIDEFTSAGQDAVSAAKVGYQYFSDPSKPTLQSLTEQEQQNRSAGLADLQARNEESIKRGEAFLSQDATTQAPSEASALGATQGVTLPVETPSEGAQGQTAALDPTSDEAILANRAQREAQFAPTGGLTTVGGASLSEFLSGQAMPEQGFTQEESPLGGRGVTLTQDQMNQLSAEREARLDARLPGDQSVSDRDRRAARGDGISMADQVAMAKANDPDATPREVARGNQVANELGVDLKTGQPLQTAGGLTETERLNREKFELEQTKFIQSIIDNANIKAPLSIAQKKFAEEAGKGAYSWDQGGRQTSQENIGKFGQIIQDLEQGQLDTRTLSEFVPFGGDWWRSALNPTGQQGLDNVRGVIFQGLRDTLGAQFTEKEGERLVNAAYNPKLNEEQNIARLKPALARMKATFRAKEALTKHIMDGGDIREYKGKTPMDVYKSFDGQAGSGSPIPGDVDVDVQSNAQAILDRQ